MPDLGVVSKHFHAIAQTIAQLKHHAPHSNAFV
jgi:hypothetical protein